MTRRVLFLLSLAPIAAPVAAALPTPEQFLGHAVGADRKLAGYAQIVRYLEILDRESPRLELRKLGRTTLGREMVMAVISNERTLSDLPAEMARARRLADPRGLAEAQASEIVEDAKVIVLVTCNIHSSEIGASQMAMEWAHQLVTRDDPQVRRWLDDVILLLMPSINPDGTDMIVDYYEKYVGTPWEGGRLPWLYHHYAGHDNNRDWFMLNLVETRIVNRVLHHEWFPQVFLDMHQMGMAQPRIFVPPYADPHTPLVHPMQWRLNDLIGTHMALRLEEAGKSGVIQSFAYDAYWPGGTKNTACLKNVIGLLTEVASCRIASPVFVDANELQGGRKGLPEYRAQMNFPNPWPGGWWRLRDIVDYELLAGNALLETCSNYRREILRSFAAMGRDAIERGSREPPHAYVIPAAAAQHDPHAAAQLADLLVENGVQVEQSEGPILTRDGRRLPEGSLIFPADQPYRSFLIEMMERQRYPEVRQGPDTKEIYRPYDVTAWTLPLMMGVDWVRLEEPPRDPEPSRSERGATRVGPEGRGGGPLARYLEAWGRLPAARGGSWLLPASSNRSYQAVNRLLARGVTVERALHPVWAGTDSAIRPGDFIVPRAATATLEALVRELRLAPRALGPSSAVARARLRAPRIGLYKPWAASMDEGWTRLVLDRHDFKYESLDNAAMKRKGLRSRLDVIVLPDVDKNVIVEGKPKTEEAAYFEPLPPPYAGGIGKEGVAVLREFVEQGGTLVCLTSSGDLAIEELNLPVRNVAAKLKAPEFSVPGTLVNLRVDPAHPVAWGMPERSVAYATGGPVFATSLPGANVDRSVVARYPEYADEVVASGWAAGTQHLAGRAAIVEARLGAGRVVLVGPRVQHRGQMVGTYKLLFNALLGAGLSNGPLAAD
jgi:hypothetical protein